MPLVPVIVTVYVAAIVALHASVAVPDPVTLLGVIAPQFKLAGTVSVRLTVPVNPLTADIVMVDVAETPALIGVDVAEIVKSVTVNVALAE